MRIVPDGFDTTALEAEEYVQVLPDVLADTSIEPVAPPTHAAGLSHWLAATSHHHRRR